MKVKDLIAELQDLDPEAEVMLQKDPEGNGYRQCRGADGDCIWIKDGYEGTMYTTTWSADDACMEQDEWDELLSTNPRCVVIFP